MVSQVTDQRRGKSRGCIMISFSGMMEKSNKEIISFQNHMSLVVRKPVLGVSDQVPHKPGCTATEDG